MYLVVVFICLNLFSVFLSLACSSWFILWACMELSSFSFIPLMVSNDSMIKMVSGWKYFVIQSISSVVFVAMNLISFPLSVTEIGLVMVMLIKMGAPPFSGWVFQLGGSNWWWVFILCTLQKAVPVIVVSKLWVLGSEFMMGSLVSCIIGFSFLSTVHSMQWMILYSSVYNVSWMMAAGVLGSEELVFYYVVYVYQLWVLFLTMQSESVSVSALVCWGSAKVEAIYLIVSVLFLMGLPPLGMFLPKIGILSELVSKCSVVFVVLTVLTTVTFIMYLKVFVSLLLSPSSGKSGGVSPWLLVVSSMPLPLMMWMF